MKKNNEPSSIVTIIIDRVLDNKETKLAWCFVIDNKTIYFPKSQVEDIRESSKPIEIDAPFWLIKSKGLEDYIKD